MQFVIDRARIILNRSSNETCSTIYLFIKIAWNATEHSRAAETCGSSPVLQCSVGHLNVLRI